MLYLVILCNFMPIFLIFEPSKINYARGLLYHFSKVMTEMVMPGASQFCRNIYITFWAHAVRPYHWRNNIIVGANCLRPL
ncbi:MAG: hypothetical protein EWV47_10095 [Microcystis viridis Mv_BB_P_19951000_S68]|jgi:hypothetical protein|uniref:Uncharacterized protein n=1 Tax=Microcystis viridis Mv_BB_P_19951000_S68D TaxID=2486270 RepID=A0A552H4M1_MICVR|nr:MAG: hypothetical protein EWV77_24955 [Microcystis viridis Mv_BB_P_19951000_S68D]TRU74684.1 MAG: hypothetical protein EWV47_10095 [Microcystis viridis Mv_BB_P_19951000_S68]